MELKNHSLAKKLIKVIDLLSRLSIIEYVRLIKTLIIKKGVNYELGNNNSLNSLHGRQGA